MANTYTQILTKGYESSLSSTSIVDGKLRFTRDTGRLFVDDGNVRIEITDFEKGLTQAQILATLAPLPKVYLSSDTHKFFIYDSTNSAWTQIDQYNAFVGATSSTAGSAGLVPTPVAGDNAKYLSGSGSFTAIAMEDVNGGEIDFGDLDEEVEANSNNNEESENNSEENE